MGKTQSKRSVDITTETKKGTEDESTEKMEKIEDLDKKEVVNGDATISEKSDSEKKYYEEAENDKDMTTEKGVDVQASGDAAEPQNVSETGKDDGGLATAEEISPLADESIKKSKKEKVKKKWSFRSISFGKKDKQKPAKNEDDTEDGSAATNGADTNEKTITEPEETQKDKSANENEEKTTENHENGNATPNELNADEQKEKKISDDKSNDITANTTAETCEPVQNETAAVSSELSEKTENTAVINETKISENATVDDASNNGNGVDEKMNATCSVAQKTDVISVKSTSERTSTSPSTNGEVIDQIHQNGDHGESEQEVIEKSKAQIEVNSNTDKKVSAATLDSISSKSTNPSHVQIHLTASSEKTDEIIQINNDESVILKSTDIEINNCTVDQSSLSEIVDLVNDFDNKVHLETVSDLISETVDNTKSFQEKLGVDPSPPPLPISPPPSQVSVFAFTNNEEPVEDSNQTKNVEPSINNLNKANEKEIIPILSEPDMTEICNRQETDALGVEHSGEETTDDQVPQLLDAEEAKTNVEAQILDSNEIEEASASEIFNKDSKLPSSGLFEKSQMDEETTADIAAAVVNGITETALKIVNEQLKCNEEQISDEQPAQKNEEKQDIINENDVVVELNDNKDQNDEEYIADKEFKHEVVTSSSIESPLVSEQINNFTTECSLDITASDLIQGQDDMVSLKKSDNIDEELLDPTKEFANTKDFKDNVIVAEITQDLPVACE